VQETLADDDLVPYGSDGLDITDATAVRHTITSEHPDLVIHCAALTNTTLAEQDPAAAFRVNAEGAVNVAGACAEIDAVMLYVSTNEVFDGEKGAPYDEDDATNPVNEYGRSKLAGEQLVREALDAHFIVRTSWLYGPGRISFPEKILERGQADGRLKLVTDEVATPTWTHDLAEALARLIRTQAYGTYHLVNRGQCSRAEWGREIVRLAGLDVPIEETTQGAFGSPFRKPVLSTLVNKRAAALGITLRPWEDALVEHMRITGALAVGTNA
jgi:dTDP-4-dehydrorhamnose reductase